MLSFFFKINFHLSYLPLLLFVLYLITVYFYLTTLRPCTRSIKDEGDYRAYLSFKLIN